MAAHVAPESREERAPDEAAVADAEARLAGHAGPRPAPRSLDADQTTARRRSAVLIRVGTEHAVRRGNQLIGERRHVRLEQLLAQLRPVAAQERHLELAQ